MYWAKVRDSYSPFESGMKSGTARVYDHQIPGGQYSNLIVQCNSMGLSGDAWEGVLNAYRDVNMLFGDIVKVTPSSKCVGDLALYLVTRGLTCQDLLDPAKAGSVDFPESVVGLLMGDLGFPHRGFPKAIEDMVLKGAQKRSIRAGLQIAPCDFAANIATLSKKFNTTITPEQAMSSLMYPKVFSDYYTRIQKKGPLLPYLPSLVYFYGLAPGEHFTVTIPTSELSHILLTVPSAVTTANVSLKFELVRVSSLSKGKRSVVFKITNADLKIDESQSVDIKDSNGVFVFEGPLADPSKTSTQMASPMPGIIEKLFVKEGDVVKAGDTVCVVSAMKMEVKVTAPADGTIASMAIPAVGYRVIEGALLMTLK